MSIEGLSFMTQVVLCILFYNYLDLHWLLYVGWAVLVVAMLLGWGARVAFETSGESREGESWLRTTTVVTTGIYSVVRHPMYLSFLLMSLTLVLLSQHWLNALLGAVAMGLMYNDMCREEKSNVEKFGDAYRTYMEQVPRMNLVVGIIRLVARETSPNVKSMHLVAGALVVVGFALMWILDDTVHVMGLSYLAWAIWVVAMVLLFLPMVTLRRRGQVPKGKSYVETRVLVDSGVYALVRHPQYLGWMLMYAAMLLFKPNWILAILGILGMTCVHLFTAQEDGSLMEKFGEPYKRYMEAVPQFNILAGLVRQVRDTGGH
jgi:protein-S-isoprenylcysteine O-methyltransferase Ste14